MSKSNSTYDPGTPSLAVKNADGTWSVDSFRGDAAAYVVNLETRSCTCPSAKHRPEQACKHVRAVAEQATFAEYAAKAAACSDAQLERLLVKYADDPMLSGAIRVERHCRKQAAREEQELLAIFA